MKVSELKKISDQYSNNGWNEVFHFTMKKPERSREGVEIVVNGKTVYSFPVNCATDYFIFTTASGKKVAISYDPDKIDKIETTDPRDTIFLIFKDELEFTEEDFANLEFDQECSNSVQILAKGEDFYSIRSSNRPDKKTNERVWKIEFDQDGQKE